MRVPILSREELRARNFRTSSFCLVWIARHARQTDRRAVAGVVGMTDSIEFGRIPLSSRLSRLLRETHETRPTAVLSRCLSLPLGERHARQDRVRGAFLKIHTEVERDRWTGERKAVRYSYEPAGTQRWDIRDVQGARRGGRW